MDRFERCNVTRFIDDGKKSINIQLELRLIAAERYIIEITVRSLQKNASRASERERKVKISRN